MSAIWGMIDLKGNSINSSFNNKMEKPFYKYKIDRYETKFHLNILMGCGLQHITKESENEILPIFDYERQLYMTADCILDNRSEIIKKLGSSFEYNQDIPDGTLIYQAYLKWGEECAKYLRGVFSFAIYDGNENKFLIYADQVFERSIYYYCDKNSAYFSTLLRPIVNAAGKKFKVNEEFICDSLSTFGLRASIESDYTPYEGVKKVEAGCYIKITPDNCEKIRYWSPKENQVPVYDSPEKAGEYCRKLMELAVEDVLRCNGNIGAALSSGLDSSTVCGIAATKLKEKRKSLYTYTFIPLSDYTFTGSDNFISDETEGVQLIADMHDNIKPHFLDNKGSDAFKELAHFVDILEIPFKAVANMPSINNICKHANLDQCKIFLTGQYGNVTISQGSLQDALYNSISKFKFVKAYKIISGFHQRYHISRKRFIKDIIKRFSKYPFQRIKYQMSKKILDETYVNKKFAKKMKVEKKLRRLYYNFQGSLYFNIDDYHYYMYEMNPLLQMGEINTKIGLANGIVMRDPTKDIRIIEFCSNLPMDCFYHKGLGRWLIRGNMGKYVPDKILMDVRHRGLQSADYLYRINQRWSEILPELKKNCLDSAVLPYINSSKVEEFFAKYKDGIENYDDYLIDPLLYIMTIENFMNSSINI